MGERKLVYHANLRMPGENCVGVHFFENGAAIIESPARDVLQAVGSRDGVLSPMRLKVTDDNIAPLPLHLLSLFQHLVGLADAGGVAEVDLESSGRLALCHGLMGEHADVDVVGAADQAIEWSAGKPLPPFLAGAVAHENLRDAAFARKIEDGVDGIFSIQKLDVSLCVARDGKIPVERGLIICG